MNALNISKAGNCVHRDTGASREIFGWTDARHRQIGFQKHSCSKPITHKESNHRLTFGRTGSGKGVSAAIPELLTFRGNAVVLDVKGELFHVTSRWRREELGHQIVVFDPFGVTGTGRTDSINPLDIAKLLNCSAYEAANKIATSLCGLERKSVVSRGSSNDEFWQNQATALAAGVIGAAMEGKIKKGNSIPAIRSLLKSDDAVYNLASMLDKDAPSLPFREEIAAFLQTTEVTRSGILSTLNSHFRGLAGENIDKLLNETTFDLKAFVEGELEATVYVIIPPEQLIAQHKLIRLIFETFLSALFTRRYIPRTRTLVQLDECAALGQFDPLRTGMTLFRASGVVLHALFQDIDQLTSTYSDAKTIINNAGIVRILGASTYWQAKILAGLFGTSPSTLMDLGPQEQVLVLDGTPQRCRRVNYLQDQMFADRFDPNPRHSRSRPR